VDLTVGQALPDNTMSHPAPAPAAHRRVVLSEDGTNFLINGMAFMMGGPPMFVARSGTVEEWDIDNKTDEVHAFHVHQVHFLLLATDGRDPGYRRWLDTVNVPPRTRRPDGTYAPGSVRILVDFRDPIARGTFVFHCHILDHEDHGMMATIRVI
jgi:FtsP/CotA-like multicopper oxidase with cupredoxin domain